MKHRMLRILFLLLTLSISACDSRQVQESGRRINPGIEKRFSLGGAPVEVFVILSAESIELTEVLTLTVRIEHAEDVQIEVPYLAESVYSPLMLLSVPDEEMQWSEPKNRVIRSWHYRFEPMSSGDFQLHPFRVYFRLESEKTADPGQWPVYRIDTEAIPYRVTSVPLSDQADIRDIKGLILPPFDFKPLAVTALGLGAAFLVVLGVYRLRHRTGTAETREMAPIDHRLESLERLAELEKKDYLARQEYERLHVELSGILRDFIENRFALKALEQTTQEFIRDIQHSPHFDPEQQAFLNQFLELADLVKFATYDPGPGVSREALQTVRQFIESTENPDEH